MRFRTAIMLASVALALSLPVQDVTSQGKGGGKGEGGGQGQGRGKQSGKEKGPDKERGPDKDKPNVSRGRADKEADKERGRSAGKRDKPGAIDRGENRGVRVSGPGTRREFRRIATLGSMPQPVRRFAMSRRPQDVVVAAAVAHAFARGRGEDFLIVPAGDAMRLTNRNGEPLLVLDDRRARGLGRWRVGVVGEGVREGAPSFCRSGAGHPVWGREWCIDKGFGLGSSDDFWWGRATDLDDVVFSRRARGGSLVGSALESLIGTTAFNRLALHAVTLGLVEPLVGSWVSEPEGPEVLLVNSGPLPVAELVDVNRDGRADHMLVALRSW